LRKQILSLGKPPGPDSFGRLRYESFAAALHAANEFVSNRSVKVLNVETVVLPNVWDDDEQGTADPSNKTLADFASTWHQFIRVWYEQ